MRARCDRCRKPLRDANVDSETWERTFMVRCRKCAVCARAMAAMLDDLADAIAHTLLPAFSDFTTTFTGGSIATGGVYTPMRGIAFPAERVLRPAKPPERVWLRRTKGWRMPPNTVKVTRGNGMKWGNPYRVGDHRFTRQTPGEAYAEPTPANVVKWFRAHVLETPGMVDRIRAELRGKNLACFCKPGAPCHADVLLVIANG